MAIMAMAPPTGMVPVPRVSTFFRWRSGRRQDCLCHAEQHVWLEGGGQWPRARLDDRQISTGGIGSVRYLKFPRSPEQAAAFPHEGKIVIGHPQYQAEQKLAPEQLQELAADFQWFEIDLAGES